MKTRSLLFVAIVFAQQVHAQSFLTNGLVVYYPFNGSASDASGYGNDGTVYGATISQDRFGNTNSAYYFAGDGSYISVSDSPTLDMTNALTLSAWIKIEPGGLYQPRILHKHVFDFGLSDTGATPQLFLNIQNYPSGGASVSTSSLQSDQWIFVAGTYDQQVLRLYTNGIIAAELSTTVPIDTNDLPLAIGRNTESGTDWYSGYMDDIRIYSRALSVSEIQQLYAHDLSPVVSIFTAVEISWPAILNVNYQVQWSPSLDSTNWTSLGAPTQGFGTNTSVFDSTRYGAKRFYRVQVVP